MVCSLSSHTIRVQLIDNDAGALTDGTKGLALVGCHLYLNVVEGLNVTELVLSGLSLWHHGHYSFDYLIMFHSFFSLGVVILIWIGTTMMNITFRFFLLSTH